ncbi:protein of unknown function [Nitrospina watsonii]|uniref:Uncharacterized protein n=1 Tax=Nitrospina watsonii TaxID=1323948 RepID=A0ABM9HHJ6_9BACT|nr:protein of unknown function [Nitrospina watsonii]
MGSAMAMLPLLAEERTASGGNGVDLELG